MESICNGEKIWDEDLIWNNNRTWPEFTECFQNTVLIWIASGWLWMTAPLYLTYLIKVSPQPLLGSWKETTKQILTALQLMLCATKLMFSAPLPDNGQAKKVGVLLEIGTLMLVLCYVRLEKKKGFITSGILCIYWMLVCLTYTIAGFAKTLKQQEETDGLDYMIFRAYFALSVAQFILSCFAETVPETAEKNQCPLNRSSFLSRISFNWLNELIKLGYSRPLTDEDLYQLHTSNQSKSVIPLFEANWETERNKLKARQNSTNRNRTSKKTFWNIITLSKLWKGKTEKAALLKDCDDNDNADTETNNNIKQNDTISKKKDTSKAGEDNKDTDEITKPGVSLVKVIAMTFGLDYLIGLLWNLVNTSIHFFNPILLKLLIDFAEDPHSPSWRGHVLATGLLVLKIIQVFTNRQLHGIYYVNLMIRVRGALTSLIYKKSLSMNNAARVESTVGEIVNLMSVDAEHVRHNFHMTWAIITCPLSIILSLVFLYNEVGYAMFGGLGVLLVVTPINVYLVRWCRSASKLGMEEKDKRMKLMNEILNGIKVLKLYAWEMAFGKKILDIREKEAEYTRKDRTAGILMHFSWLLAPFVIAVATFSMYIFMSENHRLDAKTAFVAISLFDILRGNLNWLPWLITDFIKAAVSVKRLNKFLNYDDINTDNVSSNPSDHAITISNGTFRWDDKIGACLKDINVAIPKGGLVAVVGSVGCGKSSLISAILGEMEKENGQVNVDGSSAYVPQQAWIQNASLRNNVLFGKPMHKSKYEKIINACALKTDLEMFEKGDKTMIGEKGVNLSGGQKQRVSLARAVYFDADIYLLDDPLSAVDSHVGKHIFQQIIGKRGLLKHKTRVLVTHGIKWLPYVDRIIAMDKGVVAEVGSYEQLMGHDGAFAKFMKTYLTEHNSESDSDEEVVQFKAMTLQRLDSVNIEDDRNTDITSLSSKSKHTDVSNDKDTTGLRRRKASQSDDSRSDMQIFKRSTSFVENTDDENDEGQTTNTDEEEEVYTGDVGISILGTYLQAIGYKFIVLMMLFYGLDQLSKVGASFWLTEWTADSDLHNLTALPADSEQRYQSNVFYLSIYGSLGIVQAVVVLLQARTHLHCSLKAGAKIHKNLLTNVLRAPMSFFDTTPVGRIVSRFSKDVNSVDFGLPDRVGDMVECILRAIATVAVIIYSTPGFVAMIIPLGIIYLMLQRFFTPAKSQIHRLESKNRSPIYSHFSETLNGVSVIRAFKLQRRFEDESERRMDRYHRCQFLESSVNHWLGVRMNLMGGVVTWLAAMFAVAGRESLSASLIGLSVTYAMQITHLLEWMMHMISNLESDLISMERITEYTCNPTEALLKTSNEPRTNWPECGNVDLTSYSVRYREGRECVLKGIDVSIKAGEKVGIVGRTGAGKSSLTYSVFRLLEPASGSITIDGEDVTKFGLHDLRSRLTILPQEPVLFAGSLRMNLDPLDNHTDKELWRALEHAHLQSYVEKLPDKLNYECGEGGQNLSVGQRQLVCLARSLLRKSKILVLDEATAAVDMATDELIQKTINTEFKECTVMTIAHRLNTVIDYDKILVLDKGEVKEFDSPKKLLDDNQSVFYGMARDAGLV